MITNFKRLHQGGVFYLPQFPGSTYRKVAPGAAEIVVSRHDSAYNGHILRYFGTDRPVATDPSDTRDMMECQVCSHPVGEPYDRCLCYGCMRLVDSHPCLCCGDPTTQPELCHACARTFYTTLEPALDGLDLL